MPPTQINPAWNRKTSRATHNRQRGADIYHLKEIGGFYGCWAGIAMFVSTCILGYLKRPQEQVTGETEEASSENLTMHASIDNMHHRANE